MKNGFACKTRYDRTNNSYTLTIPFEVATFMKLKPGEKLYVVIERLDEHE
ncbi:MAG: hypothetical protein ACP5RE_03545 [Candidatus Acidifodinimicrobium sp.]